MHNKKDLEELINLFEALERRGMLHKIPDVSSGPQEVVAVAQVQQQQENADT